MYLCVSSATSILLADAVSPSGPGTSRPSDLYTVASIATLVGASTLTVIISNTCQQVFNFNPKWLALLIAEALSFAGAFLTTPADHVSLSTRIFLAFINGFVIYTSAVGAQQITGKKEGNGSGNNPTARVARQEGVGLIQPPDLAITTRREFLSRWY